MTSGSNSLEFTWLPSAPPNRKVAWITLHQTDPANPIRQLECRESGISKIALFVPDFIQQLTGYSVIRFMDWQNINANEPVTWATRSKPETQNQAGTQGVAIENMVALANQAKVDPWFSMPWNADEQFVRSFATYVRDNLARDRKVYVEMSNEVWNGGFAVARQAVREGMASGLSKDEREAGMLRYAEKSTWMNKIWADVFRDNPKRLVRVLATQNANPRVAGQVLKFRDTAQNADALATAPYFGHKIFDGPRRSIVDLDNIFAAMPGELDAAIALAAQNKAIAQRYGKRYIAYEAGQHIVNATNVPLVAAINRDPRMHGLYWKYLNAWEALGGDTIVLYSSTGPISKFGAWGLREYAGQPLSETPKRRAVMEFMAKRQPAH